MDDNHQDQMQRALRKTKPFLPEFRDNWNDWGRLRAIYWAIMHLLARRLGFHVHYVYLGADRIDLWDPNPPEVPPEYDTKLVGLSDLLPYVDRVPGITRKILEEALEFDDECAASFYNGQLVAYSFNKRSRAFVTQQLDALIPNGFRYVYKSWTHPEHTRRGLSRMGVYVRRSGPKRCYEERSVSYVETHNYPSLLHRYTRPCERSLVMGIVGWATVFGKQIPFNSRRAKWLGFEFVRKSDLGQRQYVH